MKLMIYVAVDKDGDYSAAGASDYQGDIVRDWNLCETLGPADIYRLEVDAPDIKPPKIKQVKARTQKAEFIRGGV